MLNLKPFSIKNYVIILIGFFIIISIIITSIFFTTFQKLRINGSLYISLKESKDLKADIFPPKLYIIESYLLLHQLVNEYDESNIQSLIKKISKSKVEYFQYYGFWRNHIEDTNLRDLLLLKSHSYVVKFFEIYENKILPISLNKDKLQLQNILVNEIEPLFNLHRIKIDAATLLIEASSSAIEINAQEVANSSFLILSMIYIFSMISTLIISIFFIQKIKHMEDNIITSKNESELSNKILQEIVTELRRFKHNYENTLASIKGYLNRNDLIALENFIEELITEKNHSDLSNYTSLDMIKNSGILGLIVSKLIYAEKFELNIRVQIESKIEDCPVKNIHLNEILGIVLDNGIESASESINKKITLLISESEDLFVFEIENSMLIIPDRLKMFERGWSSKGNNRGLGLWILKNLIAKYPNIILNTFIQENSIKQELIITKNKSLTP